MSHLMIVVTLQGLRKRMVEWYVGRFGLGLGWFRYLGQLMMLEGCGAMLPEPHKSSKCFDYIAWARMMMPEVVVQVVNSFDGLGS